MSWRCSSSWFWLCKIARSWIPTETISNTCIICVFKIWICLISLVADWGRDKMAAIFQTTCSNGFYWMKMYELQLKFHWCLFPRVQLTIFQHWFSIYESLGLNKLNMMSNVLILPIIINSKLPASAAIALVNLSPLLQIMAWWKESTNPLTKPILNRFPHHLKRKSQTKSTIPFSKLSYCNSYKFHNLIMDKGWLSSKKSITTF